MKIPTYSVKVQYVKLPKKEIIKKEMFFQEAHSLASKILNEGIERWDAEHKNFVILSPTNIHAVHIVLDGEKDITLGCEHDWHEITVHDEKYGKTYRCSKCGEEKFEPDEKEPTKRFGVVKVEKL